MGNNKVKEQSGPCEKWRKKVNQSVTQLEDFDWNCKVSPQGVLERKRKLGDDIPVLFCQTLVALVELEVL